jgi:hypothetical protein
VLQVTRGATAGACYLAAGGCYLGTGLCYLGAGIWYASAAVWRAGTGRRASLLSVTTVLPAADRRAGQLIEVRLGRGRRGPIASLVAVPFAR